MFNTRIYNKLRNGINFQKIQYVVGRNEIMYNVFIKIKESKKRLIKNTYGIEVYIPENKNIEKVFILPFYFAYKDIDKILTELR